MTDDDIERLRKWAKWREENATHYEGCENNSDPWWHTGCAVMALIDHLKKVESERDEAIGQSKSLLKHLKQAVANQKQSTDAALELFSRLQKAEAQRDALQDRLTCMCGDDIDRHPYGDGHNPVTMHEYSRAEWGEMASKLEAAEAQRDRLKQALITILFKCNHDDSCNSELFSNMDCSCHIGIAESALRKENKTDE